MNTFGISPLLISILTNQDENYIPAKPTISMLPSKYAGLVAKNMKYVQRQLGSNIVKLMCKDCGEKGSYDLGLIAVKDNYKEGEEIGQEFQSTGYIRCKHCNSAGNWETSKNFPLTITAGLFSTLISKGSKKFMVGENRLYDGSQHRFGTDCEEHLLKKLKSAPDDSYVWNRLGNIYYKGNRPDLAVAAFEQSVHLDRLQTESYLSLSDILYQIGEVELSRKYYFNMLLSARKYDQLDPIKLRTMLANSIQHYLTIDLESGGEISFLPGKEDLAEFPSNSVASLQKNLSLIDFEISPDDATTLYPLAEVYMGEQAEKIPRGKQTLKKYLPLAKKRKKKRKKK
jgi:tetratricopeptide (TPR) repeat protein